MANTKEKMKHLQTNLFLSLGSFGIAFGTFLMIQDNNYLSFFIAFVIYLNNVLTATRIDYLDEQVKKLKDNQSAS